MGNIDSMNLLFLKRFIQRPFQVASVIPSSRAMVKRVASKFDFSEPKIIVEFGPGEGAHTREIARRMHAHSTLILFEIDPILTKHLEKQFAHDKRVIVVNGEANQLQDVLRAHQIDHCDYVVSGIPFSILEKKKKDELLDTIYRSLKPEGKFIIYQVTNELCRNAKQFSAWDAEYYLFNIPPMYIVVFKKKKESSAPVISPAEAAATEVVSG